MTALSTYRQAFEALLQQCAEIDFDGPASANNNLRRHLKHIDETYAGITTAVCSKIESHTIISDILNHFDDGYPVGKTDYFSGVLQKYTENAIRFARFEMNERLIPFNIAKGNWYAEIEEFEQALAAWEDVFKIDPDNAVVRKKNSALLRSRPESDSIFRQKASSLIQKYALSYETSFGAGIVQQPSSLLYSQRYEVLLVSDAAKKQIHKFSLMGDYHGSISLNLKEPWGLFTDVDGYFWVCDWADATLKKFDIDGVLLKKKEIRSIAPSAEDVVYPRFGAVCLGKMYVVLTDPSSFTIRRLICCDETKVKEIAVAGASLVHDIKATQSRLYIGCHTTGRLFYSDHKNDGFVQIAHIGERPLSSFALTDNAIFLMSNCGLSILKTDLSREYIFLKKNIRDMITKAFSLHMVASTKIGAQWYIFACDPNKQLIHVLKV